MKKVISIVLALTLCVALAACGDKGPTTFEKLCNTWVADRAVSVEDMQEDVTALKMFYQGEMEFATDTYFTQCYTVKFNADHSYEMFVDKEATKASYTEWFEAMLQSLYENREDVVVEIDGEEYTYPDSVMECETYEEFVDSYIAMYDGYETCEDYVNDCFDDIWDIYSFGDAVEKGTYTLTDKISLTVEGESESEYVTYKFEENGDLTLGYANEQYETYHLAAVATGVDA